MRVPFKQGLIRYQTDVSNNPTFLQTNGNTVNLVVSQDPTIYTITDGSKDYLFTESSTVISAWTGLTTGLDHWLYFHVDKITGIRSFGVTQLQPIVSHSKPSNPLIDQHWFDLTTNKMKVWNGIKFLEVLRVFAAKVETFPSAYVSMSDSPSNFAGSQVGLNVPTLAGSIMVDANGNPLRNQFRQFYTTEDKFLTGVQSNALIKLESTSTLARSSANLPAFTIVQFADFNEIVAGSPFSISGKAYGIILEDAYASEEVDVQLAGSVVNPSWNWSTINAPLYIDTNGELVETPVIPNQRPVAVVIGKDHISLHVPPDMITGTVTGGADGVVSGGSINYTSGELTLTRTEGLADIVISGLEGSDGVLTGGSFDNVAGELTLTRSNGLPNVVITGFTVSAADGVVTGGSLNVSTGDLTLTRSGSLPSIVISGIGNLLSNNNLSDIADTQIALNTLVNNNTIDSAGKESKIRFNYDSAASLPDPVSYQGMLAHVYDQSSIVFAHNGAWRRLLNAWQSDSLAAGANLTLSGGGEILGLPVNPTSATSATSKNYVDTVIATHNHTLAGLTDTSVTSPTSGQVLSWSGSNWVNQTLNLTTTLIDLTDTNINSPSVDQVLSWSGTEWVNQTLNLTTTVTDLTDTNINSPSADQVLTWSGTEWINQSLPAIDFGTNPTPVLRQFSPIVGGDLPNLNIDRLDAAIGQEAALPMNRSTGGLSLLSSCLNKIEQLDFAIGPNWTPEVRTNFATSLSAQITTNISIIDQAIGADVDMSSVNYISTANNIYENLSALDTAVANVSSGPTEVATPYDLTAAVFGTPANGEIVFRFVAPRAFLLPDSNIQDGFAVADVAPGAGGGTDTYEFDILLNGAVIGTVIFNESTTVGTLDIPLSHNIVAGDVIKIQAPSSPTIAPPQDLQITMSGIANATVIPYDMAGSVFGIPGDGEVIMRFVATRPFTLRDSNLPNAGEASSDVAAGAGGASDNYIFDIIRNGTVGVGTITFAQGSNTGTVDIPTAVSMAQGDTLRIVAPVAPPITPPEDVQVALSGFVIS